MVDINTYTCGRRVFYIFIDSKNKHGQTRKTTDYGFKKCIKNITNYGCRRKMDVEKNTLKNLKKKKREKYVTTLVVQ